MAHILYELLEGSCALIYKRCEGGGVRHTYREDLYGDANAKCKMQDNLG